MADTLMFVEVVRAVKRLRTTVVVYVSFREYTLETRTCYKRRLLNKCSFGLSLRTRKHPINSFTGLAYSLLTPLFTV